MKKKKAIKIIKQKLPYCIHAVLIKRKGGYTFVLGKEYVSIAISENRKIKRLYSFLGLPGVIKMTKF